MSDSIFLKVKEFVVRLIRDQNFRSELEQTKADQRTDFLAARGYAFTPETFEAGALKLIDAHQQGEFAEVNEAELASVLGGYIGQAPIIQPMYGVIWWPRPKPIGPQPLYGVVLDNTL